MDRLEAMVTLLATVEGGSLSAAARRLNTPLPTVSRRISELEAHLSAKLINRSNRRLVLTDTGSAYVAACRRILAEVTEAERSAGGEYSMPTGTLAVTAPRELGRTHLLPIVAEFLKAYPYIKTELILNDRTLNLVQEEIDVALRIGALPDSSMKAMRVGGVRRVVCANPDYLARHGMPGTPDDLAMHHCISSTGVTSPEAWAFAIDGTSISIPIRSRLAVSSPEAACDAAVAGLGIACTLSCHIESALAAGALTTLLDAFEPTPLPVHLVYAADRHSLPVKVRAFLDLAAPLLRRSLAAKFDSVPSAVLQPRLKRIAC